MSDEVYRNTIDWSEYWEAADEAVREDTGPSGDLVVEPFTAFLAARFPDGPDSYADVGCGPGDLVFEVGRRYPEATAVGYDSAEAVLAVNRKRARHAGLDVTFEQALAALYDAVAPGGYLVVHYHNRLAQAHYSTIAESPHEYLDEDSVWAPETFTDRFELVIAGQSLLSYERIHEVLGTWPQSVFSVADGAEQYAAHRHEPLVYVPK